MRVGLRAYYDSIHRKTTRQLGHEIYARKLVFLQSFHLTHTQYQKLNSAYLRSLHLPLGAGQAAAVLWLGGSADISKLSLPN